MGVEQVGGILGGRGQDWAGGEQEVGLGSGSYAGCMPSSSRGDLDPRRLIGAAAALLSEGGKLPHNSRATTPILALDSAQAEPTCLIQRKSGLCFVVTSNFN